MTVDLHLILADSLGLILIVRFPSFEVSPLALVVHFLPYSALAASVNLITSIISIISFITILIVILIAIIGIITQVSKV